MHVFSNIGTFVSRLSGNHPSLPWQHASRDRVTCSMRTNNKLPVERLLMFSLVGVIVLTLLHIRNNLLCTSTGLGYRGTLIRNILLSLSLSLPCLFESLASFVKLHFISISYVTHSIGQMYTNNQNRTGACYLVSMT